MKRGFLFIALFAALTMLVFSGCSSKSAFAGEEAIFYVATDGDDNADGTQDRPFGTLQGAKTYLAAHKGEIDSAIVYFREGSYQIESEIRFDQSDFSGVRYKAYPGEQVTLTATTAINGFSETTVNGVKAFVKDTDLRFNALYHQEKVITTPRYPKQGNFSVKSVDHSDDLFTEKTTYWDASRGNTSFNAETLLLTRTFPK